MTLLDVARGAYVRSPRLLRRSLAPFVSLVPTRMKFGGTYRIWRERIARSAADPVYASEYHIGALRSLIAKARANSPFYRKVIDDAFGSAFDPATLLPSDIRHLPILTKADLIAAGDDVLATVKSRVEPGDTSGSNGERPFRFYLDRDRSAREMAFVYHNWARAGFTETDSKIVLRGFGLEGQGRIISEWEPALRELRLSVFPMTRVDVDSYLDLIDQYEVRYLYGYPSAIDLMCRHIVELGRAPRLPILAVLPISEPLLPHQRATIAEALGPARIANFYGMSEKVLFASELEEEPGLYEFEPLYGLAELVDDEGKPLTEPGQEGRIIGTGFLSTGMPFIRYDTHDRGYLVRSASPENGQRLRVARIVPRRKPDYLISRDGDRVVTIDFTPEHPRFFKGIDEYQFYQDTPGEATIRYIPSPDGTEQDALNVAADLQRRARNRIHFRVERVRCLAGGRAGKRAFIDQRLDLARY